MDVSVIIINYNTRQMTAECIESVFEKTSGIDFEVILVDNASTDGSKEYFEKDNRIKYIYNDSNLGFGQANNVGIKVAAGRYVFLLNSDTLLVNNAIKILLYFMIQHPDCGIVGGQLYDNKNIPIHSYSYFFPSILQEIDTLMNGLITKIKNQIVNRKKKYYQVSYVTGADFFIERDILTKMNGFSKDYFMYFEETDLSYRVSKHKYKTYICKDAKIIHLENASFKIKESRENMYFNSRNIYYEKYHNMLYKYISDNIYILFCLSRIIYFKRDVNKYTYWRSRLSIFRQYKY